ncbi:MAG TPA: hypothetical protein PLO23_02740 [Alphaproteobacteria bacterium]|nr:hypothetical protein [Alphaproteobacteria bacterium]
MTDTSKKPSASELLARIKAAKEAKEQAKPEAKPEAKKTAAESTVESIAAEADKNRSFLDRAFRSTTAPISENIEKANQAYKKAESYLKQKYSLAAGLYETAQILHGWANRVPLLWPITKPIEYGYRYSVRGFKRMAFDQDQNGEYTILIPKRTAAAIALSIPLAWGAYHGYSWYYSNLGRFAYDAVAINMYPAKNLIVNGDTSWAPKRGVFIFGAADEAEGQPDVYRAPACLASPCEGQQNTVQFRMRDSAYLDIKRFFTSILDGDLANTDFGEFHDPSELADTFLSGKNVCYVEYFGVRHKTLDWYPHITHAVCEDLDERNVDDAVKAMKAKYLPEGFEQPSPTAMFE